MTFEIKVGQKMEIENRHGKRMYVVISIGAWGMITLMRENTEKTKIGNLRFPENLQITLKY